ncbi:cullin family protein [Klosneuvirus KNV1]|uniref:Cullin family protein n=1 Tax=Klosneuvirus KNV1 TaxID=1977640 RepID=A0A1V0SJC3_9VIRU|nr:cullin family protein [Klosneuvirus KNV1]
MTEVLDQSNTSLYNNFGTITYNTLNNSLMHFISQNQIDNRMDMFKQICKNILKGNNDFNIVLFHNLIFNLVNKNPQAVDNTIIEIFDEVTKDLHSDILLQIQETNFTLDGFIKLYQQYYSSALLLSQYLVYFDRNVLVNNNNKYSHINLVRNYSFYKNVINQKYNSLYLYEVLTKLVEINTTEIDTIIKLCKMYTFYIKLSFIAKEKKDTLFNNDLNKLFLITLGSNQEFVKKLTHYIHLNIVNNNTTAYPNIKEIIGIITKYFLEKDMFNMYYEKFLETRLLMPKCNFETESSFILNFQRPSDNKIIQNMLYKIEDLKNYKLDTDAYNKLNIEIGSNKFKNVKNLDHKKVHAYLFRYFAWTQSLDNNNSIIKYNTASVPELDAYIEIYNKFYNYKYPNREIVWKFNYGTAIVKLTINNVEYLLQLTTPQMLLLMQFVNNKKLTAHQLATNLNISLKTLGETLNTFIRVGILTRDITKDPKDPTMEFYINPNFKKDETNLSFVTTPDLNKTDTVEIQDKFAIGRENITQASIIRCIKHNKDITYQNIFDKIKTQLPFQLTDQMFSQCMTRCVTENYITKSNDVYNYLEETDSDNDE